MALNLTHTGSLDLDGSFGFNRLLNVCKRLKANLSKRVINEYKCLMKDVIIDNQSFKKFT